LVAIIGNKGSGKSGLAEVLALAGNSKAHEFFTFLVDSRFKSGSVQRAGAFEATLTWRNGDLTKASLDQTAKAEKPERVKYISQTYFEDLCNDHVTGRSDRFGAEIRKVLFSHLGQADRGSYQDLDEYLVAKELPAQERIEEHRANLRKVSAQLAELERQSSAGHANELQERLASKELEHRDLVSKKPAEVKAPMDAGTPAVTEESQRLGAIAERLTALDALSATSDSDKRVLTDRRATVASVAERLATLEQHAARSTASLSAELVGVGVGVTELVELRTKRPELLAIAQLIGEQLDALVSAEKIRSSDRQTLWEERGRLQQTLDLPNKLYQEYVVELEAWEKLEKALVGSAEQAGTLAFYKVKLQELAAIPALCAELEAKQDALVSLIHSELARIADARKPLFAPVEQLVEEVPGVANELKVGFQSGLFFDRQTFAEKFFSLVKQNTGGFRGDEEGPVKLLALLKRIDFNDAASVVKGLRAIRTTITGAGQSGAALLPVLRAKVTAEQLYAQLFELKQLDAKFSLSLAGTAIQQMSPGQRGALLLIFYLLVDTDRTPLILDQPEENLDNQTVYSMLVPIIQRAKERRQIVMVTHNANLAVCCDAEQIIHAEFDRGGNFALTYDSGAIESSRLNKSVLDVLEGTTQAFDNRRDKYHH
jgi:energy-coupling factor transporter ATP-binding protein EcfA2